MFSHCLVCLVFCCDMCCRYLHAYEDFNRKLGCSLVSSARARQPSNRSLMPFRERGDRVSIDTGVKSAKLTAKKAGALKEDMPSSPKPPSKETKEQASASR